MILTHSDIQRRREELLQVQRTDPVTTGTQVQYFFAHETDNSICGIDAVILDMRRQVSDPTGDMFFVDLAITTSVPGYFVELLDVAVTSMSAVDTIGNKQLCVCRWEDVDVVTETMNTKFQPNKPKLQLVTNNKEKVDD